MELDITMALRSPATALPFEAEVEIPEQELGGEVIRFDTARLSGTFFVADEVARVDGELQVTAHGACALCMSPAAVDLKIPFSETFRKDADETQDECFLYSGHSLPLDHMTLTIALLNLPMRFLCSESCEGSEEWREWKKHNKSSCEDGLPTQRPFEALQSLLKKDEEV